MLSKDDKFLIGDASKICNISKKALRYYDKIDVIKPDEICEENGYRYYSRENIYDIVILKYFKQMGYKLDEMRDILQAGDLFKAEESFKKKIDYLTEKEMRIRKQITAVKDWYELIMEAQMAILQKSGNVNVKFLKEVEFCCLDQLFEYDYKDSILNVDWIKHLEENDEEITGPVILAFDSYIDKMNGKSEKARIMQISLNHCKMNHTTLGGQSYASIYHVGPHFTINESYRKIEEWAESNGFICGPQCYERYLTDYWTTEDENLFVSEILIPIKKSK